MDQQVQEILQPFGISQGLCGMVSNDLLKFEYLRTTSKDQTNKSSGLKKSALVSLVSTLFSRKTPAYDSISQEKTSDEETLQLTGFESESLGLGMTEFLLKFGEGVEEVSTFQMYLSAFTIGFSYFIGGLIPMVNVVSLFL
jgi:VIT1/CCC1 family predicted Fe2+/Mn2+ transporter